MLGILGGGKNCPGANGEEGKEGGDWGGGAGGMLTNPEVSPEIICQELEKFNPSKDETLAFASLATEMHQKD